MGKFHELLTINR